MYNKNPYMDPDRMREMMKEKLLEMVPDALMALKDILWDSRVPAKVKLQAAELVLDRFPGKPPIDIRLKEKNPVKKQA